ncbi:MAG: DNA-directed RNA polymerase subunit beta, partial [Chloroflexota bacterium]
TVGHLLQNQFRIGMLQLEQAIKERMSMVAAEVATPTALINARPVTTAIRGFCATSQLSQFMDQTNPLAELTHKRRLSAMGPGGLSRERAGFEVRDVHHSHYGRICPIETPEGPNIGLIGSLATYARINELGFIETPYRQVVHELPSDSPELVGRTVRDHFKAENGRVAVPAGTKVVDKVAKTLAGMSRKSVPVVPFVSTRVKYLMADAEEQYTIAQANTPLNNEGEFVTERAEVRKGNKYFREAVDRIDLMDVSPKQIFSVSASLIPFLEHDDANRALMGSNMQRQAVPLVRPEAPLVATGMEGEVSRNGGQLVVAEQDGEVTSVTGAEIKVRYDGGGEKLYKLVKFRRTNQGTCLNQRPVVNRGDKVRAGQVLADGTATDHGELAVGRNVVCAFMSWRGYNYEDAIVLSERLSKEDMFSSVHVEKYEIEARNTKLGPEEITRDIPGVAEESLRNLDEVGIVRLGAEVSAGDILVGKITPKGETELTPEEKLLRTIFGEKIREVKDNSLRVPHGESGKVMGVKIFTRENHPGLPAEVNKLVRVWVGQMRKISVGDKMTGRHGNKGVVARILPEEDMPFLPDGTPVDILLNPIGVPSRMNLGQVLEANLGWAAKVLDIKVLNPVFEGARDVDVENILARAWLRQRHPELGEVENPRRTCLRLWFEEEGMPANDLSDAEMERLADRTYREGKKSPPIFGKIVLRDGCTGDAFEQPITVGCVYMMKLIHLVEDKIHARSTGPYSLITQQPLGGKAQFGGQRFGEMEVWALEAYGAAHILRELLTVKSDDIMGRAKTYEAIVKGEDIATAGAPESFKILFMELRSLGLAVELLNEDEEEVSFLEEPARPSFRPLR